MKLLIKLGFLLLALAVIGVVVVAKSLDRIAAESIRRGGTNALGVETDLESVDISLGGEVTASLRGLTIANPEGFQSERFLALGEGSLVFPLKGVFADVVTVPFEAVPGDGFQAVEIAPIARSCNLASRRVRLTLEGIQ